MGKECLRNHQGSTKHTDWWWPFSLIDRAWTSFCKKYLWGLLDFSKPPRYLFGNLDKPAIAYSMQWGWATIDGKEISYPKPVPPVGKWYLAWPPYIAYTFETLLSRWLARFGFRYTEVTNKSGVYDPSLSYYNFPTFWARRNKEELSDDLRFAISRRQLRNHLLHAAVAVPMALLLLRYPLPPGVQAVVVVSLMGVSKEWFEVIRRGKLGEEIHFWDGIFDLAGWVLFAVLTVLIHGWNVGGG